MAVFQESYHLLLPFLKPRICLILWLKLSPCDVTKLFSAHFHDSSETTSSTLIMTLVAHCYPFLSETMHELILKLYYTILRICTKFVVVWLAIRKIQVVIVTSHFDIVNLRQRMVMIGKCYIFLSYIGGSRQMSPCIRTRTQDIFWH